MRPTLKMDDCVQLVTEFGVVLQSLVTEFGVDVTICYDLQNNQNMHLKFAFWKSLKFGTGPNLGCFLSLDVLQACTVSWGVVVRPSLTF